MASTQHLTVADRLVALFDHLGIARAHVVGWGAEIGTLAADRPDRVASATLVCPMQVLAGPLRPIADRLLFIHGDQGPSASRVPDGLPSLPGATEVVLREFFDAVWSDPAQTGQTTCWLPSRPFLATADAREPLPSLDGPDAQGNIAGISYRSQGDGPPLMFLPIALAASQWEPLIPVPQPAVSGHQPRRRLPGGRGRPGRSSPWRLRRDGPLVRRRRQSNGRRAHPGGRLRLRGGRPAPSPAEPALAASSPWTSTATSCARPPISPPPKVWLIGSRSRRATRWTCRSPRRVLT